MKTMTQLSFTLRCLDTHLTEAELPTLTAEVRNDSDQTVGFCHYLAEHRLLSSVSIWGYGMHIYQPTAEHPLSPRDFCQLAPGQSWKLTLDLAKAVERGYRLVWLAGSAPVTFESDCRAPFFPASSYTLTCRLDEAVLVYRDEPGRCGKRQLVELFQKAVTLPENLFRGKLQASCDFQVHQA